MQHFKTRITYLYLSTLDSKTMLMLRHYVLFTYLVGANKEYFCFEHVHSQSISVSFLS